MRRNTYFFQPYDMYDKSLHTIKIKFSELKALQKGEAMPKPTNGIRNFPWHFCQNIDACGKEGLQSK